MQTPAPQTAAPRPASIRRYRFIDWLAERPFVDRIVLYGSRARGDHHDRSDIDLAIECPRATISQWYDLVELIEERADTLLGVDLVRLDQLATDDPLRASIMRDGVDLYRRSA